VPDHQTINVTQIQKNEGCLGGCGTIFAVTLLIGLAVEYWYVALAAAVVGAGIAFYLWQQQPQAVLPGPQDAEHYQPISQASATCGACGHQVATHFCGYCGLAQTRTCAGCGRRGLTSSFCPDCGSATYQPPAP